MYINVLLPWQHNPVPPARHRRHGVASPLNGVFPAPAQVHGLRADVSSSADMAALGAFAQRRLGAVDLWINNAGEVTRKTLLADVEAGEVLRVVGTS